MKFARRAAAALALGAAGIFSQGCFGTPTPYNGKIYIQTTRHLYCFGKAGNNPGLPAKSALEHWPAAGPATQLQIIPSEVLMRPGQTQFFRDVATCQAIPCLRE